MTGHLKIILGYAAGVGKTYRMLEEGQRLLAEGHDVVIGYFEPHGRQDTIAKTEGLESIPRRAIDYRGRHFEEMDTPAILARHPKICLVDEFPHTNVPGAERAKRWEDVLVLLDTGIDVITTMNIQHLESLNDQMREITGIQVRETIPDWVVDRADEIVLADLTPRALLNRLDRGVVYAPDKAQRAKQNFFKETTLAALREIAHEIAPPATSHERILIHITPAPETTALIRRGRRVADYLNADCIAVCLHPEACQDHLNFARQLHIETHVLAGEDEAQTLVDFAHANAVTQIYLAQPPRARLPIFGRNPTAIKVIRLAKDIQVTVVADRRRR
jgi:two-component system sensor histidine kinase KdpD